jgi:crotonobetainyl-CoA:carnitine CoA-transferase CaiB-like acyl-CoA transferase
MTGLRGANAGTIHAAEPAAGKLTELLEALGVAPEETGGTITITGEDPMVASPHRLGTATAVALSAVGATTAAIWKMRTGRGQDIALDARDALHALHAPKFYKVGGHRLDTEFLDNPLCGFQRCGDGRWLFVTGSYPPLLAELTEAMGCDMSRYSVERAFQEVTNSEELETRLNARGLPATIARSYEEWLTHPQGALLHRTPIVEIIKIADGPPEPFAPGAERPLSGIRIFDMTHVAAGPLMAQTAAEQGADVLHVSPSFNDDYKGMNVCCNAGKRLAYLNMQDTEDYKTAWKLLEDADVYVSTYQPGSLESKFGLSPHALAKHRPGIIVVQGRCYGFDGPFAMRPGFEQNGQTVAGIAVGEGAIDSPRLVPDYFLNDWGLGYLGAAGMQAALIRRAKEGGSYHVRVSLARWSMWVQEFGVIDPIPRDLPLNDPGPARTVAMQGPWGEIDLLAPVIQYSETKAYWALPPAPFGSHKAEWAPAPAGNK